MKIKKTNVSCALHESNDATHKMRRTVTLPMLSWASPSLARLAGSWCGQCLLCGGPCERRDYKLPLRPSTRKRRFTLTSAWYRCRTFQAHWTHAFAGVGAHGKMIFCGRPSSERLQEYGMYFLPEGASSMPKNTPGQDRAGDLQRVRLTS